MRLELADAARALGVSPEVLEADLEAGAPRNKDGTLNLVAYAAWLNYMIRRGELEDGP